MWAFIAVGSNIEPERNICEALRRLKDRVRVVGVSPFYRTLAVGSDGKIDVHASAFVNGVFEIETELTARELKDGVLGPIETALGRTRTADKFAARTIDLDLVLYGDVVSGEPDLRLPHPDIRRRAFVAVPLAEIAPELVLPDTGEKLGGLAISKQREGIEELGEFTRELRAVLVQG
ncbi:MAG TPA: 2-amino-4-hydroxy-6-hydroxymethyldihydropteridine diphosphokinase [Planctomycetota bacterium]